MPGLLLKDFAGEVPVLDPRALSDNGAAYSLNQRLNSGVLEPIRMPKAVHDVAADTKYAYRLPTTADYAPDLSQGYWWEFKDLFTDVARGPTVNDSFERYYYCSPSTDLRYATKADIIAGNGLSASHAIGVPRPTQTPTIAIAGGSSGAPIITRDYVFTFQNQYGEESGPSPAGEAAGPSDATWTISNLPVYVEADIDFAAPTQINIYRTITATSGSTVFNLVTTVPVGTASFADNVDELTVGGQTELATTDTDPPPRGLQGLALMPNGIMVAFADNNIYFSDNFKPWSWPAAYTLTVPSKIVGLAVIGNTCVVCTVSIPCTLTGSTAASMSLTQNASPLPCVSRRSIAVAPEGVYWASFAGLALFTLTNATSITDQIIASDHWANEFFPTTLHAAIHSGQYVARRQGPDGTATGFGFEADCVIRYDDMTGSDTLGLDAASGKLWMLKGAKIYELMPPDTDYKTMVWRSKSFEMPKPMNMGVLFAYFSKGANSTATVRVLSGDGVERFNGSIQHRKVRRLPATIRDDVWQLEITTDTPIQQIAIAQTIEDLKKT